MNSSTLLGFQQTGQWQCSVMKLNGTKWRRYSTQGRILQWSTYWWGLFQKSISKLWSNRIQTGSPKPKWNVAVMDPNGPYSANPGRPCDCALHPECNAMMKKKKKNEQAQVLQKHDPSNGSDYVERRPSTNVSSCKCGGERSSVPPRCRFRIRGALRTGRTPCPPPLLSARDSLWLLECPRPPPWPGPGPTCGGRGLSLRGPHRLSRDPGVTLKERTCRYASREGHGLVPAGFHT
jgi:hypothetical protein